MENNPRGFWGLSPITVPSAPTCKSPPLNFKGELWLATQDTFHYSDFIFVGALAGISMAENRSRPRARR